VTRVARFVLLLLVMPGLAADARAAETRRFDQVHLGIRRTVIIPAMATATPIL